MARHLWLVAISLISAAADGAIAQTPHREAPVRIFAAVGLTPDETAAVDAGRPVARVLSWGSPSEVYVFGAVQVEGAPERYIATVRDLARLRATPGYLGAGELRSDASLDDVAALTFEGDDIKALKNCRQGSCDVQLPTQTIDAFRTRVDWSRPDADAQVNALARATLLELLGSYQQGGNHALGEYRDKKNPARVAEQFETMLQRASALPDVLPELRQYLTEYPAATLPAADTYFYWEKVDFGLKPTIRLNHGVIYRGRTEGREFATVAIKQLYATHYFHTALDVSVCLDRGVAGHPGFYLLTLKGSQQEGLTGVKGSLMRKVVVDKTRGSLERALAGIKRAVEHS